jgi:uncharacterized repeat protein (TIGR03803 family)
MVYSVNTDGSGFADLHDFDGTNDGANPVGGLLVTNNNILGDAATYLVGTTFTGGTNGGGTVFGMNLSGGSSFRTLHCFGPGDGANPKGRLSFLGSLLYGTTSGGGAYTNGMVFEIKNDGTGYTDLYDFNGENDGSLPLAGLSMSVADDRMSIWSLDTTINVSAQNVTNLAYSVAIDNCFALLVNNNLVGFGYINASATWSQYYPLPYLRQGQNDVKAIIGGDRDIIDYFSMAIKSTAPGVIFTNLFGSTFNGGTNGYGTVYEITPEGYETNLHSFSAPIDGENPIGDLILSGNTLYGTTQVGGTNSGQGTIFSVNTDGSGFQTLYTFTNTPDAGFTNGANPYGGLLLSQGNLYGTARNGGANGYGEIFKIDTDGSDFSVLYSFSNSVDGAYPYAGLTLAGTNLYGTTIAGNGTVFSIGTNGENFETLYTFAGAPDDGEVPEANLLAFGNTLYGTTYLGGQNNAGTVFSLAIGGTNDVILYSFSNAPDGAYPVAGLTVSDTKLYGTTYGGGQNGNGSLFCIATNGSDYTNILSFGQSYGANGINPPSDLKLLGNSLYGTTKNGGAYGYGMIFNVNTNGFEFNEVYDFRNTPDGAVPNGGLCSP